MNPGRRLASILMLSLAASMAAPAHAFPDKPVRLVCGYPAGGATDLVARTLSGYLSRKWGQQAIVDTRSGASGMIAAEQVVRASPDGYTLLVAYTPEVLLNKLVFKSMRYDPQTDLAPVILAAQAPLVLAAGPKSGVSSMAELRAAVQRPLSYASPGVGGQQHIAGELLQRLAGLNLTHVPYKGTGPAVTDLVGGQIDLFFATTPPLLAQIQAGKLKPLMVAGPSREKLLPNVPTATEVGLPRLQLTNWFGVYAPKGMPPALLERLAGDIAEALADPAVVQALEGQGLTVTPLRGAAFASFLEAEMQKYRGFVSETGITAE